jgi:HEAT repeat protein
MLGQIGDVRALEPLIGALEDPYVDKSAAEALGKIGDTRSVHPLIPILKDEHQPTRQAAVKALGQIGGPAVYPLIDALKYENLDVRRAAAVALVTIYESGRLEAQEKNNILARENDIKHYCEQHIDRGPQGCSYHEDYVESFHADFSQ